MDVEDADEDYPPNFPMAKGNFQPHITQSWMRNKRVIFFFFYLFKNENTAKCSLFKKKKRVNILQCNIPFHLEGIEYIKQGLLALVKVNSMSWFWKLQIMCLYGKIHHVPFMGCVTHLCVSWNIFKHKLWNSLRNPNMSKLITDDELSFLLILKTFSEF